MIISTVKSVAIEVAAVAIAFALTGIALTVQIPLINAQGVASATAWVVLAAIPLCAFRVRAQRAGAFRRSGGGASDISNRVEHANPKITLLIHAHALEADELAAAKTV